MIVIAQDVVTSGLRLQILAQDPRNPNPGPAWMLLKEPKQRLWGLWIWVSTIIHMIEKPLPSLCGWLFPKGHFNCTLIPGNS